MDKSKGKIIPAELSFECDGRPIIGWLLNEDDSVDPITVDGVITKRPYRLQGPFKLVNPPAVYNVK